MSSEKCRSWFCVWNNAQECYPDLDPTEIAEEVLKTWIDDEPTRTGAVAYCISADGLHHLHMVLEDSRQVRFTALKKLYPKAHLEETKGNKSQAEDYINKKGKWEEKGEQIVYIARFGEIKGNQGSRRDLGIIDDLLEKGLTPKEIMRMNIVFRKYEKLIRDAYFDKRVREMPFIREVEVIYHVGASGCGKTYTANKLVEQFGEDNLYFLTDYDSGFDKYNGESILFLDEFRGQLRYAVLLGVLQGYKQQLHARYSNVYGLWDKVHISTVLPPEQLYKNMVSDNKDNDTQQQLFRRISKIVYHWKDSDGTYHEYEMDMKDYVSYEMLKMKACSDDDGFMDIEKLEEMYQEKLPFD